MSEYCPTFSRRSGSTAPYHNSAGQTGRFLAAEGGEAPCPKGTCQMR